VAQLAPPALGLARQLLGRHEEAQDVVQEAFLRLWSSRLRDRGDARLSTCFHTIVINRCRSRLSARRETPLDPEDLAPLHEAHAGEASGPDMAAPDAGGLHAALATLPVRQRMALVMWAWADADAAAIGDWLGIETNAAHQLLHRARRTLRERLSAAHGDDHDERP
jgi:RNA polymerase sigma-70 factor (ECF subfamily)